MEDFQWTLESMQRSPAWQHLWDSQKQNTGQALVDYQTMKSSDLRFLVHQIHFLFQLNKNTSCLHKSCCTGSFIQTLCPQASQCPATNTRLTKQLIEKKKCSSTLWSKHVSIYKTLLFTSCEHLFLTLTSCKKKRKCITCDVFKFVLDEFPSSLLQTWFLFYHRINLDFARKLTSSSFLMKILLKSFLFFSASF